MTSLIFLETEHEYHIVDHDIPSEARDFVDLKEYEDKYGKLVPKPLKSVTTFVSQFEKRFDSEGVLDKMFEKAGEIYDGSQINIGKNEEYQGLTREEVQQLWDLKRERACRYGTWIHKEAEEWLLGNRPEWERRTAQLRPEFKQVKAFFKDNKFECEATELRVYDAEYQLAGTLDLLVKDKDGKFWVADWKTNASKDLTDMMGDHFTEWMHRPVSNLKDLPYWHYALQFSMYRYLMEKNDGLEFAGQVAVHLKREGSKAEVIYMPYLKDEVERLLVMRKRELEVLD